MIEQLIARVFYARNVAHFAHWKAKGEGSYARHIALGDFYEAVVDALDALVEAHQGVSGLIGNIPAPPTGSSDPVKVLEGDADWIEQNHDKLCGGNRAVANLVDGVTGVYLSAIYKLKNLK